jgi:hypothetical protein
MSQLGALAEWLRSGLQSRLHRFDSGGRLSLYRAILGSLEPIEGASGDPRIRLIPIETGSSKSRPG